MCGSREINYYSNLLSHSIQATVKDKFLYLDCLVGLCPEWIFSPLYFQEFSFFSTTEGKNSILMTLKWRLSWPPAGQETMFFLEWPQL